MNSYRKLEVWKRSYSLAREIYRATEDFPRRELYGMTAQLRRAAVSIPSNIAEGEGRYTRRESIRFLRNSRGSLFELETQLLLSGDFGYLDQKMVLHFLEVTDEIGRMISGLVRYLARKEAEASSAKRRRHFSG